MSVFHKNTLIILTRSHVEVCPPCYITFKQCDRADVLSTLLARVEAGLICIFIEP